MVVLVVSGRRRRRMARHVYRLMMVAWCALGSKRVGGDRRRNRLEEEDDR